MASITFKNVTKVFDGETTVIPGLDLEIRDKEFVILVGPSGCGKSTTLRMIAGLEDATSGDIYIGKRRVNGVPPKDRNIAMVFQSYALYPHMTVFRNMAFALELQKLPKDEIEKRVREAARVLDLEDYLDRKPRALSGGQRQRVALGRAMVRHPAVFLLDEPLSNLDAKLRTEMRAEISALHKKLGVTFVYVTHDQTEAMTMADRIVVMEKGVIRQTDTPQGLYLSPKNVFVATFIGTPRMNLFPAEAEAGGESVTAGGVTFPLPKHLTGIPALKEGRKNLLLGIRPEHLTLTKRDCPPITVTPDLIEMMGSESHLFAAFAGEKLIARVPTESIGKEDKKVDLYPDMKHAFLFDAESGEVIE